MEALAKLQEIDTDVSEVSESEAEAVAEADTEAGGARGVRGVRGVRGRGRGSIEVDAELMFYGPENNPRLMVQCEIRFQTLARSSLFEYFEFGVDKLVGSFQRNRPQRSDKTRKSTKIFDSADL